MAQCATATNCQDARAVAVIEHICKGHWRAPVEAIRGIFKRAVSQGRSLEEARDAVSLLKRDLPGVIFGGKFTRRNNSSSVAHSGLLCADIDTLGERLLEVRTLLLGSPHVYGLFLSPTGSGLKAVFRVVADPSQHTASFAAVRVYVHNLCGVEIDGQCGDLARLCFVSFDPDAFLNRDAAELPPLAKMPAPISPAPAPERHAKTDTLPPSMSNLLSSGAEIGERKFPSIQAGMPAPR
jgi:hypothetical protein